MKRFAAWLLIVCLLFPFISYPGKAYAAEESDDEDLQKETRESLQPYLDLLGAKVDSDNSLDITAELYYGLSKVTVMGIEGTVSYTSLGGSIVNVMRWASNGDVSHDTFLDVVSALNGDSLDDAAPISSEQSDETYVWADTDAYCIIFAWLDENTLHMKWESVNDLYITTDEDAPSDKTEPAPRTNTQSTPRPSTRPTPSPTSTPETSSSSKKTTNSDPYDVYDYPDPEEFYYYNFDNFYDFEDAENYFYDHVN